MALSFLFQGKGLRADLALIQQSLGPALEGHLMRRLQCSVNPIPQKLYEAMSYGVLGGGKRLRAYLFLAAEHLSPSNLEHKTLFDICCAIECLQAYSLIHDDLPGMDDSDLRRGKPSVHKAFDHHTAILAGSSLQNLAFEIVTNLSIEPEKKCALIQALSVATGPQGMMAGQQLDMDYELSSDKVSRTQIERMQHLKTASFFQGVLQCACIISASKHDALNVFGAIFGRLFQLTDDILDATSSSTKLGKPAQHDGDKQTLVDELGLEGARQECEVLQKKSEDLLGPYGEKAGPLLQAISFLISRSA